MSLRESFERHKGRYIGKIDHFFDVYETHFARFKGQPVRILEIGVFQGGSLELWRDYFGSQAQIHGLDINPKVVDFAPPDTTIHIGSQGDADFLRGVAQSHGPFDIIIDDGSHLMEHQITSFKTLYPLLHEQGIYICEDAFTSYWREFGGQLGGQQTFMEYAKHLIDELHAFWAGDDDMEPSLFTRISKGIHFYSGTVVFERHPVSLPVYAVKHQGVLKSISIADLKLAAAKNKQKRSAKKTDAE